MHAAILPFAPPLREPHTAWSLPAEVTGPDTETWLNDRVCEVSRPALGYYPAPVPNGTSVIICPGGGYQWLSMNHEGVAVATWLNSLGVGAFVLKSRLHPNRYPAPMQDLAAALNLVRSSAPALGLQADKVGVLGFSAGGHLAASACVAPLGTGSGTADPFASIPPPRFAVLLYPVISMNPEIVRLRSRDHLLGVEATPEMMHSQSLQSRVCASTPPTLLIHCHDDDVIPPCHSELFHQSLRRHRIPCSLHLFPRGGHGFGTDASDPLLRIWPTIVAQWMNSEALR